MTLTRYLVKELTHTFIFETAEVHVCITVYVLAPLFQDEKVLYEPQAVEEGFLG